MFPFKNFAVAALALGLVSIAAIELHREHKPLDPERMSERVKQPHTQVVVERFDPTFNLSRGAKTSKLARYGTDRADKLAVIAKDSLVTSTIKKRKKRAAKPTSIPRVRPKPNFVYTLPAGSPLGRFNKKLVGLKRGTRSKPITIVHIGDSHISSDSFTRGIRSRLQKTFGNAGRGAVIPANAYKYANAQSVKLSSTGSWRKWMSLKSGQGVFGVSGVRVESASPGAEQRLHSKAPFDWVEVTAVTGPAQGSFVVTAGGISKRFSARASQDGSKTVRLRAPGNSVKVRPAGDGQFAMLHWATGRDLPGIRYVNFGQAGATVGVTRRWDPDALASDLEAIDPDLIVYGYGTNEGFNDNLNLKKYRSYVVKFAQQLRKLAPNADLMVIGAASGLRKRSGVACGNGWNAPPKLGALRTAMKQLSREIGAGYWDWADAMGGPCSIDRWARKGLASRDRVHLTPKGYDVSANFFVRDLLRPLDNRLVLANKP